LSTSDSYATTYAKATSVIKSFQADLGANTVRFPINPYTVNGSFWSSYTGAIDAATAQGFKVVLGYWEGTGSAKDGLVDNTTDYWTMWRTVTTKYAGNSLVYFEPMNEPYGYSKTAWADLAAQWISTYPSVPKDRIFVSGTGYNDNVTSVCADSRLNGTYLSLHHYGFWNTSQTSYSGWVTDLKNRIGSCASRTVMDEWGAPMTTGLDYNGSINGNYFIAYLQADSDTVRSLGMGSIYWPGLRNGDTYSMTTLVGSGTNLSLSINNASGAARLAWAWGNSTSTTTRSTTSTTTRSTTTTTTRSTTTSTTGTSTTGTSTTGTSTGRHTCAATYQITGKWQGGFQAGVTVTAGSAAINGWTVTWTLANGQTVSQAWNATLTSSGTAVTATNVSWNGSLGAGAATTFGLIGTSTGTPTAPTLTCTAS
jgi:hypothetical protein